jgi:hypothetical protein
MRSYPVGDKEGKSMQLFSIIIRILYDYVRGAGPLVCTESIHADQRAGCCEQAPARRGR